MLHLQVTKTTMELLPLVCVSLLTWSGTTFADENGRGVQVAVEEGGDAILPCSLSTKENIENMVFDWKKDGRKEVFFYDKGDHYNKGRAGQDEQFKGRVFHFENELKYGNASIRVQNTKMADNGTYTCNFPGKQMFYITLFVDPDPERYILKDRTAENIPGAAAKPSVKSLQVTKDWARLQCEAHGAPKPKLHWQDSDGNILPGEEPQVSEQGGRFYVTLQTTVNKTDLFRCVAMQEEIGHQIYDETHVYINGAAPKPSITSLDETKNGMLLQCEVRDAFPKPKLHWQDSDGNILHAEEPKESERGGGYNVILQITVTKTDNYRCVATQEEINHQIYAETFVPIHGFPIGWFVGAFFLGVIVVLAVFGVKRCISQKHNKDGGAAGPHNQQEVFPA